MSSKAKQIVLVFVAIVMVAIFGTLPAKHATAQLESADVQWIIIPDTASDDEFEKAIEILPPDLKEAAREKMDEIQTSTDELEMSFPARMGPILDIGYYIPACSGEAGLVGTVVYGSISASWYEGGPWGAGYTSNNFCNAAACLVVPVHSNPFGYNLTYVHLVNAFPEILGTFCS